MTKPLFCSVCGEEVRWGTRGSVTGYLHREDADHVPIFGRRWTAEDQARVEEELDRVRTRTVTKVVKGEEVEVTETYTARTHSLKADAKREAEEEDEDFVPDEIPAPEVPAHDVTADDFPPRSGIRQIANLVTKTAGWTIASFTACRGPYIGSKGKVLSISDCVVLRMHGPMLDNGQAMAVASWRDGSFDFAYTGTLKDGVVSTTAANSASLKAWIKETASRDVPPPVQDLGQS